MSISFKWKDQGSGYRKGKIWLQIIRGMEKILETSKSLFGTAPHSYENVNQNLTRNDSVLSEFKPVRSFSIYAKYRWWWWPFFACSKFQSFGGTSRPLLISTCIS